MNNYQDLYSRYHDKPTVESRPSSNNGWVYSAYAVKLGLPIDQEKLEDCFYSCLRKGKFVFRTPNKPRPFLSRDEILGAAYLGLLKPEHLNNWDYSPFPPVKFSATRLFDQLALLYDHRTDRNYFWQNNLEQIYRFAFSVPVVDRHFLLKTWGTFRWYNPAHLFYAFVAKCDSMETPKPRNGIMFLKYGKGIGESRELALAMSMEFPADHSISIAVNNK